MALSWCASRKSLPWSWQTSERTSRRTRCSPLLAGSDSAPGPKGQSIGHKGIGFKSVLEVSLTPEIYSCRRGDDFALAVRFDPIKAAEKIRENSPGWDETVRDLLRAEDSSGAFHIPTLLFPAVG